MSQLPQGPLPTDCEESVFNIIRDVGVNVLTLTVLRKRLAAKYKIDFSPHDAAVEAAVQKYLGSPEGLRELAKVKMQKVEGPMGGKGKKRSRLTKESSKDSKKDKDSRVKKMKRPDDYPKAALSAYIIFGNDKRDSIKAQNPGIAIKDILKETGKLWAAASEEEKEHYKKLAEADKVRFDKELKVYLADGGRVYKRGQKDGKGSKGEAKGPKRPLSSYMYFANYFRTKHTELSITEQMKQAGVEWKKLSDEEKKPYELKAAQDKERYQRECQEHGLKAGSTSTPKAVVNDSASSSASSESDSESDDE